MLADLSAKQTVIRAFPNAMHVLIGLVVVIDLFFVSVYCFFVFATQFLVCRKGEGFNELPIESAYRISR
jgi:hypothetical protein